MVSTRQAKMKKSALIFLSVFFVSFSFAQQVPADIRSVMDANKIQGIDVWSGINVIFEVVPLGLDSAEKITLVERAHLLPVIKSIKLSDSGTVVLTCNGGTPFDDVKKIFSTIVSGLSSITETYVLVNKQVKTSSE